MLAIVIPYYKKAYFEECLGSLVNQTNKNFKVYIGDDASPEDPIDIIRSCQQEIDIVYKKFESNLGGTSLTKQWERCIEMTNDERWVMILGDDDFISENYVAEFYRNLNEVENLNIKVVRFASRIIRMPHRELSELYTHPKIENATDFFYRKFLDFSRGSLTEQIFRKDAYLKKGFRDFPLGWGADNLAWLDFTEFGKVYAINEAVAYFRISEVNISRGGYKDDLKQEMKYKYFKLVIENYLEKFASNQRLPMLLFYERVVYNSKKATMNFWMQMNKWLLKENAFIQIPKFSRRFIIHHFTK